jgi:hypothetical protein
VAEEIVVAEEAVVAALETLALTAMETKMATIMKLKNLKLLHHQLEAGLMRDQTQLPKLLQRRLILVSEISGIS